MIDRDVKDMLVNMAIERIEDSAKWIRAFAKELDGSDRRALRAAAREIIDELEEIV